MSLKAFQQATVDWALARLQDQSGSRRVLVADEVGLGKTLVAQGILSGLTSSGRHLNVFYVCSSLSIGHQNRESLLEMLPEEERAAARVEVDRLTLLPKTTPSGKGRLTLFTLTPGTMPLRSSAGRVDERAVIARLLREMFELRSNSRILQALRGSVQEGSWTRALRDADDSLPSVPGTLLTAFRRNVSRQLEHADQARKATITGELIQRLESDDLRGTIRLLRVALSLAALESLSPDVIIFDEFQKFFELVTEDDEDLDANAHALMKTLLRSRTEDTQQRPSVVLLSATPFRMYGTLESGEHGAHQKDLFRLLAFLFGDAAADAVPTLQKEFSRYGHLLRKADVADGEVFELARRIESRLSRVMARTERSDLYEQAVSSPELVRTPLEPLDIRLFRHLCESARDRDRFMAPAYWSSIPYPLQSMEPSGYVFRANAALVPLSGDARKVAIRKAVIRRYEPLAHPHPRLRQLLRDVPRSLLSLPWLPPSRPWWSLGGAFAKAVDELGMRHVSKTLVFSRFLAVPRAIAASLSYEAELAAFGRATNGRGARSFDYMARGSSHDRGDATSRPLGEHQPRPAFNPSVSKGVDPALAIFLEFAPLPALAALGDPLPSLQSHPSGLTRDEALRQIETRIEGILGRGNARGRRRPLWLWVRALEQRARSWSALRDGWTAWLRDSAESRGTATRLVAAFLGDVPAIDVSAAPSDHEIRELAELALLAPGNVLHRALSRVFGAPHVPADRIARTTAVSFDFLRGYFDTPEFHQLLAVPGKSHRAAIRRAIWDGNFESVLDEYVVVLCGLGEKKVPPGRESRAFDALETALGIRTSSIELSEVGRDGKFKLRCHAAMPFGLSKADVVAASSGNLRSDFLRVAFNSPFRPFVLATTSIGQEGLDFHLYCRQIVHWDLPSNPVDLEQRDGRVRRFGGLGVRQVLARTPVELRAGRSPWREIGLAQSEDAGGLAPWWGCEGADVRRLVYSADFSKVEGELAHRLEELSLYRMSIGQADQEQLVRALRRTIATAGPERQALLDWLRRCRIQLSPFFRRDAGKSHVIAVTA